MKVHKAGYSKKELTHRERVRLALERKETDRIPLSLACGELSRAAWEDLDRYLKRERNTTAGEYLKPLIDTVDFGLTYIGPRLAEGMDIWGVRRKIIRYGRTEELVFDHHPLAKAESVEDILAHCWPSPDWFDYSDIPERIARINSDEEYCIYTLIGNLWEKSYYMRGLEMALCDLALRAEMLHAVMEKVTGFCIEQQRRLLEAADGKIDIMFTADDMGTQEDLLISVEMWEQHIKPYHVRQNKVIKEFGAKIMYHSDGAVLKLVPGFIDMGIDILQALQFDAKGMDASVLKEKYGDRLCFEGGVSVQKTLPLGTTGDVREEVAYLVNTLGNDGGYILGPSHEIPAGTPPENIVAMFETAVSL